MKEILLLLVLPLSFGVFGQNWTPFNSNSLVLYEDPTQNLPRDVKMISFRSSLVDGAYLKYAGFLESGYGWVDSSACGLSWSYSKMTHPWFASELLSDGTNIEIVQRPGDTLHFDFQSQINDTLWILNDSYKIFAVCTSAQNESALGINDMVKRFDLHHWNSGNNPMPGSPIHGKTLILGQNLGFLTYFTLSENGQDGDFLTMIGNRDLDAGAHSFTLADCHMHSPGTEYQIQESAGYSFKRRTYTITETLESPSSVTQTFNKTTYHKVYNPSSSSYSESTITGNNLSATYPRSELITQTLHSTVNLNKTLRRDTLCNDTVFVYYTSTSLDHTICYNDSTMLSSEGDPFDVSYSNAYYQFKEETNGTYPYFGSIGMMSQSISYFKSGNCITGTPAGILEPEDPPEGNPEDEILEFALIRIRKNTYQITGQYDQIRITSLDGRVITDRVQTVYTLPENVNLIIQTSNAGEASTYRRFLLNY